MTIEEAIKHFEQYVGNECYTEKHQKACEMAITALRAQPPKLDRSRWNWCSQCKPGGQLELDAGCEYSYCPYCGLPLTEAAWAELEQRIGGPDEN